MLFGKLSKFLFEEIVLPLQLLNFHKIAFIFVELAGVLRVAFSPFDHKRFENWYRSLKIVFLIMAF